MNAQFQVSQKNDFQVTPFPLFRQLIIDSGRFSARTHTIPCLLEVDVTEMRRTIRQHQEKTGESLSTTAFLIAFLGKAIEAHKSVQAYRKGRDQLVIFDDVDVMTYVEVDMDGEQFPLAHVLRSANRKSWLEIHREIRSLQAHPEESPNAKRRDSVKWLLLLPAFARNFFYRFVHRHPHIWKKQAGTVCLTSVGMFGEGRVWGIGYISHTLGVIVGSISEQAIVRNGQIEIRECMNLTLEFDHDIIDGAPAARFVEYYKELIEHGNA